jgi:hypothetical protein
MFSAMELLYNVWFLLLATPLSFTGAYMIMYHYTKPLRKEYVAAVENNELDKWVLIDPMSIIDNNPNEGYWEEVVIGNNKIMKHHKPITWLNPSELITWEEPTLN